VLWARDGLNRFVISLHAKLVEGKCNWRQYKPTWSSKENTHYIKDEKDTEKINVLQLGLQLGFTCNFELQLKYFYTLIAIKQIARIATTQLTIYEIVYICNSCNYVIDRSLQLLSHYIATNMWHYCNYCAITLQLLYHYVTIIVQLYKHQCVAMAIIC